MSLINQRVVYLNGVYVPENEAVVPIKDQGFKYGDGVFDTTRTFGHKIFKIISLIICYKIEFILLFRTQ